MFHSSALAHQTAQSVPLAWTTSSEDQTESAIASPIMAVAGDTALRTSLGMARAKDLKVGDLVLDEDGKAVRVLRTSKTHFSREDLLLNRALAPIRFEDEDPSDANHVPALLVAPDLPVYVEPASNQCIEAAHLTDGYTIRSVIPDEGITYLSLVIDRPATLLVSGLRLRFGASANTDAIAQVTWNWRQEEMRVFRPIR